MNNKKILILGGTRMVGRDFVEFILKQNLNSDIYIANRGVTNPNLFVDNVKHIKIDRYNQDCKNLYGMYFDLVIDFNCYTFENLKDILDHIQYKHYILISSTCANSDNLTNSINRFSTIEMYDKSNDYCKDKGELENWIKNNTVNNLTIVRPPVIYGRNDYTGRFYEKDGNIHWTHDNTKVLSDIYTIPVRKFTIFLYQYLIKNTYDRSINITRDGVEVIEKTYTKFSVHPYESKHIDIQTFKTPFKHIIIDNLLNKEVYKSLCDRFSSFIDRTEPYNKYKNATSDYDAYIYSFNFSDMIDGYDFFASKELQSFVEKSFDIKTTKYISPSAHFHKSPSRDGFIHRDMSICSFSDKNTNFVCPGNGTEYTDDSNSSPTSIKMMRSIAYLYYLNNDDSLESIGGGTGIYDDYNGNLVKNVEPKNNRIFIFEICHNSFHSYIGANFDRSAIVGWFHSSPAYMVNRNWKHFRKNRNLIEKWSPRDPDKYWPIENDPEYGNYFNVPLNDYFN